MFGRTLSTAPAFEIIFVRFQPPAKASALFCFFAMHRMVTSRARKQAKMSLRARPFGDIGPDENSRVFTRIFDGAVGQAICEFPLF